MSTEAKNNININSLNINEAITMLEAIGDWNDYGNETGFYTGHAMKNSPCEMEADKDYWYVTNICMSINSFATQTAINAFSKETFIRNRENGVWKEWSKLGNGCDADTVDGKHAKAFIEKKSNIILSREEITGPGIYLMYRANATDLPEQNHTFVILAMQEGWGIGIFAVSTLPPNPTYVSSRYTIDNGKTYIWTDWSKINDGGNADTVDGKHASEFASSIQLQALSDDVNNLKALVSELTKSMNNYSKMV